jgi:heme A synthase
MDAAHCRAGSSAPGGGLALCYFMAAVPALFIGGGLLLLALVIMIYRRMSLSGRLIAVIVLASLTSAASMVHGTTRHSGMGLLQSRGYPKPFHFHWRDFEARGLARRDINVIHYGVNTFVHAGALALAVAMLPRRRREHVEHKMRGSMVALRVFLGILLLILGVIGGFIPIMQGWIFILLGLLVLFPKARFTEKVLEKAEPKLPRVVRFLRRLGIGTDDDQAVRP